MEASFAFAINPTLRMFQLAEAFEGEIDKIMWLSADVMSDRIGDVDGGETGGSSAELR